MATEYKCKHCGQQVDKTEIFHNCPRMGMLDIHEDDSFLTSVILGGVLDDGVVGGLIGGDLLGGIIGDAIFGD